MVIQLDDTPGVMAELLNAVARYQANILTIHQSIPINGVATLTLSVEVLQTTKNLSEMVEEIEQHSGVHYLKIVGRSRQKDEDCSIGLWYRRFWCGRGSGCKSEADRDTGKRRN